MASTGTRAAQVQSFQFPIGNGATVVLSVPTPLPPSAFQRIKSWIDLMEPSLTEGSTPTGGE